MATPFRVTGSLMIPSSKLKNYLLACGAGILVLVVYFPYLLRGGWVCDDWMVVEHWHSNPDWWGYVRSWFPIFAARPFAPAVLATVACLHGDNARGYVVSHVLLLGLALCITWSVWRRWCGEKAAAVFLTSAFFPSIASTLIFSPGMQQLAGTGYLLWAGSLLCHEKASTGRRWWLLPSFLFIFLGMLIYEIFLPLLAFQCLMPLFLIHERRAEDVAMGETPETATTAGNRANLSGQPPGVREEFVQPRKERLFYTFKSLWGQIAYSTLPVAAAVFLGVLVQKCVMPLFFADMSRLTPGGLRMMGRTFVYWLFAVVVQIPLLWSNAVLRVLEAWDATSAAAFIVFSTFLFLPPRRMPARRSFSLSHLGNAGDVLRSTVAGPGCHSPSDHFLENQEHHPGSQQAVRCDVRTLRKISFVAAVFSVFLFLLSGSYAAIYGNDNRKFSSFWIALTLGASTFFTDKATTFSPGKKASMVKLAVFLLIFANLSSFLLQRNNYLHSWQLQSLLLKTIERELKNAQVPPGSVLLAALPPVVPQNHNDECVFTRSWDIASAVRMVTRGTIADGVTLYPWLLVQGRIGIKGSRVSVDELWETDVARERVYFIGCEVRQRNATGFASFFHRSLGELPPLTVVIRTPCQQVATPEELLRVVRRATEELNVEPCMSWPARVTQFSAEHLRSLFLNKPILPLQERLFHPTISE